MKKQQSKPAARVKTDERQRRLAEALRANLKKRKEQSRSRDRKQDT